MRGIRRSRRRDAWGTSFKAFLRDESGATAVEFAIIALPFFTFIIAMIDIGAYMFVERAAKAGVGNFARMIRIGQLPDSVTAEDFRQCLCRSESFSFFKCDDVQVLMQEVDSWGPPPEPPRDANGDVNFTGGGFRPGKPDTIYVITVYTKWPRFTPLGSQAGAAQSDGTHLIRARAAFKTEPYPASQTKAGSSDPPSTICPPASN